MTKKGPIEHIRKRGIWESLFPRKYDFEGMLAEQGRQTCLLMERLRDWLDRRPLTDPADLVAMARKIDAMRYEMEDKLMDAFSTPFDRQDIYTLSRRMDDILNNAVETAEEMYAFGVEPDDTIRGMVASLLDGTGHLSEATGILSSRKERVEEIIPLVRESIHRMEDLYLSGMAGILSQDDPMAAMRKREIYHHLRDAGTSLRETQYILHKAVVGLP